MRRTSLLPAISSFFFLASGSLLAVANDQTVVNGQERETCWQKRSHRRSDSRRVPSPCQLCFPGKCLVEQEETWSGFEADHSFSAVPPTIYQGTGIRLQERKKEMWLAIKRQITISFLFLVVQTLIGVWTSGSNSDPDTLGQHSLSQERGMRPRVGSKRNIRLEPSGSRRRTSG